MNYNDVLVKSVNKLKQDFLSGLIKIETESDLQSHLFCNCIKELETNNFSKPLEIRTNLGLFSTKQKIDIVLGAGLVTLEIKYEPDNSTIPPGRRPVVLPVNVTKDLEKISEYSQKGVEFSYFLFLDEDGQHFRRLPDLPWEILRTDKKTAYFLFYKNQLSKS